VSAPDLNTNDGITAQLELVDSSVRQARLLLLELERACVLRGINVFSVELAQSGLKLAEVSTLTVQATDAWIDGS